VEFWLWCEGLVSRFGRGEKKMDGADQSKPRLIIRTPLRKRNENDHGVPLENCTVTRCLSLHAIHGSTIHLRTGHRLASTVR
jgi:hypothetical protein